MEKKIFKLVGYGIKGILFALALLFISLNNQSLIYAEDAYDYQTNFDINLNGYNYTYDSYDDLFYFKFYDGTDVTVTIPATVDGKRVVISDSWYLWDYEKPFYNGNYKAIKNIVINCDILDGSRLDFSKCTNLINVRICTRIGQDTSIVYPEKLENIKLLGGCNKMPSFSGCKYLKTVAISECDTNATERNQFSECTSLVSVSFPSNITKLSYGTFYKAGLSKYTVPSSVTTIDSSVFRECPKLKELTVPKTVTSLESSSIYNNPVLNKLTFNCKINSSLNLYWNTALQTLIFNGYVAFNPNIPNDLVTLRYLGGCKSIPSFMGSNIKYVNIAKCDQTTIPDYTFYRCPKLSIVKLPTNAKVIGSAVFSNSAALQSVTLPATLVKIQGSAFYNTGLTSVTIPKNVTTIEEYAFSGCTKLSKVTFAAGSKLTAIKKSVFADCSALKRLTLPSTVKSIGDYAFKNNTKLYQIIITKNTTSISDYAFTGCTNANFTIVAPADSTAQKYAKGKELLTTTTSLLKTAQDKSKIYVGSSARLMVYNSAYKVTYSTSNKTLATVSTKGVITAKNKGTVTITATVNGKKYSYKYTIVDRTVSNVLDNIYRYYVTSSMSDYDKIIAADAWLVKNVKYDYQNYLKGTIPNISHTSDGAFLKGVAVCDGYAYAFKKIMDHYGIQCNVVTGTANGDGHAWNEVKLGSNWYQIDVTWDDPIVNGSANNTVSSKKYLLITNAKMSADHNWNQAAFHKATATTFNKQINHTGYKKAVISHTNTSVAAKKTLQLKVVNTTEKVTYSSANTAIAKVSSKGLVTGVKAGTTTINVKIGTKTFKVKVTVK